MLVYRLFIAKAVILIVLIAYIRAHYVPNVSLRCTFGILNVFNLVQMVLILQVVLMFVIIVHFPVKLVKLYLQIALAVLTAIFITTHA